MRPILIIGVICVLSVLTCKRCCGSENGGLEGVIPRGAEVVKLNRDRAFGFTEGPCWDASGALYFSDIANNRIMKLLPDGSFEVFREPSDAANGLMFNADGNLISCDGGGRCVSLLDGDGNVAKVLADRYDGKKLNSPNDLVIDSKGGIYFTDPWFGGTEDVEQDKEAVYYLAPDGKLTRVIDDMGKPNGVILSPDGKTLYVADSFREHVRAYDVQPDGTVTNGRNFGRLDCPTKGEGRGISMADGLAIDIEGNLYVTTALGVQVLDKQGNNLGVIKVPEQPANCTFGSPDYKTLFITARTSVYKVGLNVPGVVFPLRRR